MGCPITTVTQRLEASIVTINMWVRHRSQSSSFTLLGLRLGTLGAELLHFKLQTFWDKMIPYRTESVHFFVFMNSTTKEHIPSWGFSV